MDTTYDSSMMYIEPYDLSEDDELEVMYCRNCCNVLLPVDKNLHTKNDYYWYESDGTLKVNVTKFSVPAQDIVLFADAHYGDRYFPMKVEWKEDSTYGRYLHFKDLDVIERCDLYIGSQNQFYYKCYIKNDQDKHRIRLGDTFKTCYDLDKYMVFLNGRFVNRIYWRIVRPELNIPQVEFTTLYMFHEVNYSDRVEVFYIGMPAMNKMEFNGDLNITALKTQAHEDGQTRFKVPYPYKNYPRSKDSFFAIRYDGVTFTSPSEYVDKNTYDLDGEYIEFINSSDALQTYEHLIFIFPYYRPMWDKEDKPVDEELVRFFPTFARNTSGSDVTSLVVPKVEFLDSFGDNINSAVSAGNADIESNSTGYDYTKDETVIDQDNPPLGKGYVHVDLDNTKIVFGDMSIYTMQAGGTTTTPYHYPAYTIDTNQSFNSFTGSDHGTFGWGSTYTHTPIDWWYMSHSVLGFVKVQGDGEQNPIVTHYMEDHNSSYIPLPTRNIVDVDLNFGNTKTGTPFNHGTGSSNYPFGHSSEYEWVKMDWWFTPHDDYDLPTVSMIPYPNDSEKKQIICRGLYTEWIPRALEIIKQALGLEYNKDSYINSMNLELPNQIAGNGLAAISCNYNSQGICIRQTLQISMSYYGNISKTDMNADPFNGSPYLDLEFPHEFTHALMQANIRYFSLFPHWFIEGSAELVVGIDTKRKTTIKNFITGDTKTLLSNALAATSGPEPYAAGYLLLRYFAYQTSLHTNYSHQEAIKRLYTYLCRKTAYDLPDAIRYASNNYFVSTDDLITKFLNDMDGCPSTIYTGSTVYRTPTNDGYAYLKDKTSVDIVLKVQYKGSKKFYSDFDAGSIIGSDAGAGIFTEQNNYNKVLERTVTNAWHYPPTRQTKIYGLYFNWDEDVVRESTNPVYSDTVVTAAMANPVESDMQDDLTPDPTGHMEVKINKNKALLFIDSAWYHPDRWDLYINNNGDYVVRMRNGEVIHDNDEVNLLIETNIPEFNNDGIEMKVYEIEATSTDQRIFKIPDEATEENSDGFFVMNGTLVFEKERYLVTTDNYLILTDLEDYLDVGEKLLLVYVRDKKTASDPEYEYIYKVGQVSWRTDGSNFNNTQVDIPQEILRRIQFRDDNMLLFSNMAFINPKRYQVNGNRIIYEHPPDTMLHGTDNVQVYDVPPKHRITESLIDEYAMTDDYTPSDTLQDAETAVSDTPDDQLADPTNYDDDEFVRWKLGWNVYGHHYSDFVEEQTQYLTVLFIYRAKNPKRAEDELGIKDHIYFTDVNSKVWYQQQDYIAIPWPVPNAFDTPYLVSINDEIISPNHYEESADHVFIHLDDPTRNSLVYNDQVRFTFVHNYGHTAVQCIKRTLETNEGHDDCRRNLEVFDQDHVKLEYKKDYDIDEKNMIVWKNKHCRGMRTVYMQLNGDERVYHTEKWFPRDYNYTDELRQEDVVDHPPPVLFDLHEYTYAERSYHIPSPFLRNVKLDNRMIVTYGNRYLDRDRYVVDSENRILTITDIDLLDDPTYLTGPLTFYFFYTGGDDYTGVSAWLPETGYVNIKHRTIDRFWNKELYLMFVNGRLVHKKDLLDITNYMFKVRKDIERRFDLVLLNLAPKIKEFPKSMFEEDDEWTRITDKFNIN